MNDITIASIEAVLGAISVAGISGQSLLDGGALESVDISGGKVSLKFLLGFPIASLRQSLSDDICRAVLAVPGVEQVDVDLAWLVSAGAAANNQQAIPGVKNIIAVASGKGGVGKSTTAVNLALALVAEGARVGILDADIYGPSQPQMLGVGSQRPEVIDQKAMRPIEAYGVHSISMGYLVTEKTPMVWRGPMASGALQQLLTQTQWPDLDYLLIDMPPGTGDIQLTLSQQVPVSGAVIVTTPQDIALLDAKKGIEMFAKVNVPVLGVVENMATHICSNCGHEEHVFGEGGGARIAEDYQTVLLGSLPLDLSIRQDADSGKPSMVADPESAVSRIYRDTAHAMTAQLWLQGLEQQAAPVIEISDD